MIGRLAYLFQKISPSKLGGVFYGEALAIDEDSFYNKIYKTNKCFMKTILWMNFLLRTNILGEKHYQF